MEFDQESSHKRPLEEEDGSQAKRPAINDEPTMKMLVPNASAGSIIGKGGSTIKQLRETSGARINVENVSPGVQDRTITIRGIQNTICDAISMILEKLEESLERDKTVEVDATGAPSLTMKLLVDNAQVGGLIGKGGANIKAIREQCGCQIKVDNMEQYQQSPDRLVTVQGSKMSLEAAQRNIVARIVSVGDAPRDQGETKEADHDVESAVLIAACHAAMSWCFSHPEILSPPLAASSHVLMSSRHVPSPSIVSCSPGWSSAWLGLRFPNLQLVPQLVPVESHPSLQIAPSARAPSSAPPPSSRFPNQMGMMKNPMMGKQPLLAKTSLTSFLPFPSSDIQVPQSLTFVKCFVLCYHVGHVSLLGLLCAVPGGPGMGMQDMSMMQAFQGQGMAGMYGYAGMQDAYGQSYPPQAYGSFPSHDSAMYNSQGPQGGASGACVTIEKSVPNAVIGRVIGKGGSGIRDIRQASGAQIKIQDGLDPISQERKVVITGSASQNQHALSLIEQKMQSV